MFLYYIFSSFQLSNKFVRKKQSFIQVLESVKKSGSESVHTSGFVHFCFRFELNIGNLVCEKNGPIFDDYTSFFDFIFETNSDWIHSINYFLIIHLKEVIIITQLICRKEENY